MKNAIEKGVATAVEFADSSAIYAGQTSIAIGNPEAEGISVTCGIVSVDSEYIEMTAVDNRTKISLRVIRTDTAVNSGNSGGGLFELNGELVGVVNAKSSGDDIEGLAFAIPANTVKEITQELIQYGYVTGRPQLGISVAQITRPGMGRQTYYSTPGLYITQSSEDNGLKAGDRIIQIDGTTINNASDVSAVLDRHSVGEVVKVVVSRSGKETTVNVKLTEQKPS